MTDNEFRLLLEAAVCGDREALDSLLALYMPLINRLSSYAGIQAVFQSHCRFICWTIFQRN